MLCRMNIDMDVFRTISLQALIEKIEFQSIVKALILKSGRVSEAAKLVGMRRTTFVMKMKKFSLNRESYLPQVKPAHLPTCLFLNAGFCTCSMNNKGETNG